MPVPKICAIFIGCNFESRATPTEDPSTRKILQGGTTFNWVYMHTLRNFGPCGDQVKGELACVASVSVWFRSKERPRNGILGFGRARNETRASSFTYAIFRAVFDSRSSFFAPKPHGNAC